MSTTVFSSSFAVVWITKYALTQGILKKTDVRLCGEGTIAIDEPRSHRSYYHGSDWHTTEAAAIAQAEKMRSAKIANLHNQIEKLESLKFEVE